MDGGRVVRSLLAMKLNNHSKATVIAARIGQIFCFGFIIYSAVVGNPILSLVAMFLFVQAEIEVNQAHKVDFIRVHYQALTGKENVPTSECSLRQSEAMLEEMRQVLGVNSKTD
jgi:hypothetical protein